MIDKHIKRKTLSINFSITTFTQNFKLVYGKPCIVYYSNPLCNNTLSQIVVRVSCHMAMIIQMANNKMALP